jgi:hypothetical protein
MCTLSLENLNWFMCITFGPHTLLYIGFKKKTFELLNICVFYKFMGCDNSFSCCVKFSCDC